MPLGSDYEAPERGRWVRRTNLVWLAATKVRQAKASQGMPARVRERRLGAQMKTKQKGGGKGAIVKTTTIHSKITPPINIRPRGVGRVARAPCAIPGHDGTRYRYRYRYRRPGTPRARGAARLWPAAARGARRGAQARAAPPPISMTCRAVMPRSREPNFRLISDASSAARRTRQPQ